MLRTLLILILPLLVSCKDATIDLQQASPSDEDPSPVVVAYLPDYRVDAIDVDSAWIDPVTDLIYFSLAVPEGGVFNADMIRRDHLQKIKKLQKQKDCRLLLCIGGWGRSDGFDTVAAHPNQRAKMIESLATLCKELGFDGVDYDWEHPQNQDQIDQYALLIKQTASHFAKHGLMVTVAQASWQDLGHQAYDALDRVHLMSYDQAYPQATLEHARQEVDRLIQWGCPPRKIALGIPFYGRDKNRAVRSYAELAASTDLDPATDIHDGFAFNGPTTVGLKTDYALDRGLAGVMIWEFALDDPQNHTLLRAVTNQIDVAISNTE